MAFIFQSLCFINFVKCIEPMKDHRSNVLNLSSWESKPKKFKAWTSFEPDLCDTGVVLLPTELSIQLGAGHFVSCCLTAMYGSIPPVTIPPGHDPRDLPFFRFLAVYSPPPGTQKETIPHPRDSLVTHCTHMQKRNNATFCVQNQNIICISMHNNTIKINQQETLS